MRKLAILTPLKGEIPMAYHRNITRILTAKLNIGLVNILVEGVGIQHARDIAVEKAKRLDCREVVFIDKDLDVPLEAFERLLSYEHEAIVCGVYSARGNDSFFHGKRWSENEDEPHPKGLWRMWQAAIGFCKIRMSVFEKLAELYPDRHGLMATPGFAEPIEVHEAFPMELVGPNTPQSRLEAIKKIVDEGGTIEEVKSALATTFIEQNVFLSEDYGFCRMVRQAGIKILMDPHLMVKHRAGIDVPIDTEELVQMLKEPWRGDLPKGVVLP